MNRRNRLRRAALVLALLVLAAIVTGVAASAKKTVVPKQMTGHWRRNGWSMHVWSWGEVPLWLQGREVYDAEISRVTAHRLTIGGPRYDGGCPGTTGRYRWKVASHQLKLTKIHDACKARVNEFAGVWLRNSQ